MVKRITFCDNRRAFLHHTKQDHGHHFIKGLFHQDGGLHSSQSSFDAVTLDGDLRRHILKFAALIADEGQTGTPKNIKAKKQMKAIGTQPPTRELIQPPISKAGAVTIALAGIYDLGKEAPNVYCCRS